MRVKWVQDGPTVPEWEKRKDAIAKAKGRPAELIEYVYKSKRSGVQCTSFIPEDCHYFMEAFQKDIEDFPVEVKFMVFGDRSNPVSELYKKSVNATEFCGHISDVFQAFEFVRTLPLCGIVKFILGQPCQLANVVQSVDPPRSVVIDHLKILHLQWVDFAEEPLRNVFLQQVIAVLKYAQYNCPKLEQVFVKVDNIDVKDPNMSIYPLLTKCLKSWKHLKYKYDPCLKSERLYLEISSSPSQTPPHMMSPHRLSQTNGSAVPQSTKLLKSKANSTMAMAPPSSPDVHTQEEEAGYSKGNYRIIPTEKVMPAKVSTPIPPKENSPTKTGLCDQPTVVPIHHPHRPPPPPPPSVESGELTETEMEDTSRELEDISSDEQAFGDKESPVKEFRPRHDPSTMHRHNNDREMRTSQNQFKPQQFHKDRQHDRDRQLFESRRDGRNRESPVERKRQDSHSGSSRASSHKSSRKERDIEKVEKEMNAMFAEIPYQERESGSVGSKRRWSTDSEDEIKVPQEKQRYRRLSPTPPEEGTRKVSHQFLPPTKSFELFMSQREYVEDSEREHIQMKRETSVSDAETEVDVSVGSRNDLNSTLSSPDSSDINMIRSDVDVTTLFTRRPASFPVSPQGEAWETPLKPPPVPPYFSDLDRVIKSIKIDEIPFLVRDFKIKVNKT